MTVFCPRCEGEATDEGRKGIPKRKPVWRSVPHRDEPVCSFVAIPGSYSPCDHECHDAPSGRVRARAQQEIEEAAIIAHQLSEPDYDLQQAQESYYEAGGMPSQSMTPRKAPWFWRRAAKLWHSRAIEKCNGPRHRYQTGCAACDRRHDYEETAEAARKLAKKPGTQV